MRTARATEGVGPYERKLRLPAHSETVDTVSCPGYNDFIRDLHHTGGGPMDRAKQIFSDQGSRTPEGFRCDYAR